MTLCQDQQTYSAARRHNPGRFQFRTNMLEDKHTKTKCGLVKKGTFKISPPDGVSEDIANRMFQQPIELHPRNPLAIDWGINIERPKPKPLTQAEALAKIGAEDVVTMNFIPQMLTSIAMEQATELADYTRDHRMREHKAFARLLRECVNEYDRDTRKAYGAAYYAHVAYLARLKEACSLLLFQCWCTYTNEASSQRPEYPHKDIPARLSFIRMLLLFVEVFDTNADRILATKLGRRISHHDNPWVTELNALCVATAIEYKITLDITPAMKLCIQAVAQNARKLAKEVMTEEANVSKS